MSEKINNIKSIIRLKDYIENEENLTHLFEIQLAPPGLKNFRPRFNFDKGGTLLVGDLVLNIEEEQYLESHPFPEWVVQLISKEGLIGVSIKVHANVPHTFISKIAPEKNEKPPYLQVYEIKLI